MLRSRKNFWMKTRLSRTIRSGSRPTRFVLFPRMRFFSEQNSPQKTRRRKEFCGCNQKYESCSDDRNREAGQETLRDPERVQQDSPGRQPWEHPRRLDRALQGRSDLRRPFRAEPSFPCLTPGLTPWAVLFRPFRAGLGIHFHFSLRPEFCACRSWVAMDRRPARDTFLMKGQ